MTEEKVARINALARLAKERTLTAEEQAERDILRQEYLAEWRLGAQQALDSTYIVDENGIKHKLRRK